MTAHCPELELYIGGHWKKAAGAPVLNPADESVLGAERDPGNLSISNLVASIAETPFGGVKDSGYGREGGTEGLSHYTVVKNVSHRMM